jgi:hypothetical protein
MGLFSIGQKRLKPAWRYEAPSAIWRIVLSSAGHIVGECRDHERKEATFFCLNGQSGTPLWERLSLDAGWWCGIEAIHRSLAIFHGYAKPDLPEHRGIFAHDLDTGKPAWNNQELTYWFAYRDHLYARRRQFEKSVGFRLALTTGNVEEEFGDAFEELHPLRRLAAEEDQQPEFRFPEVLEGSERGMGSATFYERAVGKASVQGNAEFIHRSPYYILNYHVRRKGTESEPMLLENRLHVFDDRDGREVYFEVLTDNAHAPTPDSFFVKDDSLYFVKDDVLLTSLSLAEEPA